MSVATQRPHDDDDGDDGNERDDFSPITTSTIVAPQTPSTNNSPASDRAQRIHTSPHRNTFIPNSTFSVTDSTGSSIKLRRFERANARVLLALEAEIGDLENGLEHLEREDTGSPTRKARQIEKLSARLDGKLQKYYDAAIRITQLGVAQTPAQRNGGRTAKAFCERTVSAITALVFLIGAMLTLYFISKPGARVGALCGWTAGFAVILILLTRAQRHEVFVATAAYAAVLVVFLGGNLVNYNRILSPSGSASANINVPIPSLVVPGAPDQTQPVTIGSVLATMNATATASANQTASTNTYTTTSVTPTACVAIVQPTGPPSTYCVALPTAISAAPQDRLLKGEFGAYFLLAFLQVMLI